MQFQSFERCNRIFHVTPTELLYLYTTYMSESYERNSAYQVRDPHIDAFLFK